MTLMCDLAGHDYTDTEPCSICGIKKGEWKCFECDSIQKKGEKCYCQKWDEKQ